MNADSNESSRAERNRLEALKRQRERAEHFAQNISQKSSESTESKQQQTSKKRRLVVIDDDEDEHVSSDNNNDVDDDDDDYEEEEEAEDEMEWDQENIEPSLSCKGRLKKKKNRDSSSSRKSSTVLHDASCTEDMMDEEGHVFEASDFVHTADDKNVSDQELENLAKRRRSNGGMSIQSGSEFTIHSVDEAAQNVGKVGVYPRGSHTHDVDPNYKILTQPKDADGNIPGDPEYNRRTMRLGQVAKWEKSQVQLQWWEIKKNYADCLLFFKIGRFYEMYHTDADLGVEKAGLVYMRGEQAHAGFPEPAYGKYLDLLVKQGYKVARVEQTERPEENKRRIAKMKQRGLHPSNAEKAMRREVCSLVTPGTRCYTYLERATMAESTTNSPSDDLDNCIAQSTPQWLAALIERENRLGLCFADCARGIFILAEFDDDPLTWARLRTALQSFPVVEILLERGDKRMADLVATTCRDTLRADMNLETLSPNTEFWDSATTIQELEATQPKSSRTTSSQPNVNSSKYARWPQILRRAVEGNASLCLSALGAISFWLRRCLIDIELLSMGNFEAYAPADINTNTPTNDIPIIAPSISQRLAADEAPLVYAASEVLGNYDMENSVEQAKNGKRMALDATALKNLEILRSTHSDKVSGSLWGLFSKHLSTAMGRRLVRQWLSKPLFEINDVKVRTDAVEELISQPHAADKLSKMLKKIPDLERLLQQLHTLGSARRAPLADDDRLEQHPDSRAVLFDALKFEGKKVQQLVDALRGLRQCEAAINEFHPFHEDDMYDDDDESRSHTKKWNSILLRRCTEPLGDNLEIGCFPELRSHLAAFESGFDLDQARKTGLLEARRGSDDAYDKACDDQAALEEELKSWLVTLRRETRISKLEFVTSARDRYQVKVPEDAFSGDRYFAKTLPNGWTQKNKSKKHRTFVVLEVESMVKRLADAESRRNQAKLDQLRSLFAAFDKRRARWTASIVCIGTVDALLALARCSRRSDFCRAEYAEHFANITTDKEVPYLSIVEGKHPALDEGLRFTEDVIGNDLKLGGGIAPPLLLLSGPNMGGKSTLLRQVCLNAILAQLGSYVRADSFKLTPVDRIFTRLGASDRIMHNQSTFMLELAETADILHHATSKSLCILDELGRGTATFDGVAIAHSVVAELASYTKCRALFSTHYHDLIREWSHHPTVQLGHMDCIVELPSDKENNIEAHNNENNGSTIADGHTITFLYKLVPGLSPRSFGINVARLAKLPNDIIQRAIEKSTEFDERLNERLYSQQQSTTNIG
uniref:DNA mismatch repair protein n=1 Tax=Aureoumbra lagunensis TaxID=44058 RepID=A0A7S3JTZ3_9STRA